MSHDTGHSKAGMIRVSTAAVAMIIILIGYQFQIHTNDKIAEEAAGKGMSQKRHFVAHDRFLLIDIILKLINS